MRRAAPPLLLLMLCCATGSAWAEAHATPTAINSGSFARAHALPLVGEGAVMEEGEQDWRLTANNANEFFAKGGSLLLDAETLRVDLTTRRGFAPGWEWGLRVPLLVQGGGAMDGLIESWHKTFGLPNANREQVAHDRYRIRYVRNGQTVLDLQDGHNGLGDVQATLGWQLSPTLALRGLVQLPTGDAQKLSGGHVGIATWAEWSPVLEALPRLRIDLAGGLSVSEQRGPLADFQQPVAGFGRAALAVPVYGSLQGNLSVQLHSALYQDSGQRPISGPGGSAAFGFGFLAYGHRIDLGVEEDLLVNSAPDFALKLSIAFQGR